MHKHRPEPLSRYRYRHQRATILLPPKASSRVKSTRIPLFELKSYLSWRANSRYQRPTYVSLSLSLLPSIILAADYRRELLRRFFERRWKVALTGSIRVTRAIHRAYGAPLWPRYGRNISDNAARLSSDPLLSRSRGPTPPTHTAAYVKSRTWHGV